MAGPNYKRPPVDAPDVFRGDARPLPPAAASLADERWWAAVPGRDAADADSHGARAELRSADWPRRRILEAQAQLGITQRRPVSDGQRRRRTSLGQRPSAALGFPPSNVGAVAGPGRRRRGSSISGASSGARPRARARAAAGDRVGTAGGRHHAGQPGVERATSACARSISSSTSRGARSTSRQESLQLTQVREARRRDVAARRPSGRAAGLRRHRRDRDARAADRAAGELPQRAARRQPRPDRARPRR